VLSRNLGNEEAKAHYGAVENTTKMVVMPRKQTNKQTNKHITKCELHLERACMMLEKKKCTNQHTEFF
jgi:hypothetical protein